MSMLSSVLTGIYTERNTKWITELRDDDLAENNVSPFILQRYLAMNDTVRKFTRWLDKYTFILSTRMYISLAWSIIPKHQKTPFFNYIKQVKEDDEFDFILLKIKKQYKLSDRDYAFCKPFLIAAIKKDMVEWFSYYGIKKTYWKRYYLNFNQIKDFGKDIKREEPVKKIVEQEKIVNRWF